MRGEGSSGDIQESKQARTQKVASRACATWKADGMPPGIRCQLTIPGHLAIFSQTGYGVRHWRYLGSCPGHLSGYVELGNLIHNKGGFRLGVGAQKWVGVRAQHFP